MVRARGSLVAPVGAAQLPARPSLSMEAEDPQWISTSSGHQVAKDAALDALLANEAHRSKLREHILKLQAALAEADQLVVSFGRFTQ